MQNFIINFHGIGKTSRLLERGEDKVWISEEQFLSIIETVGRLPNVLITFDDGNLSDYTIAFPHLKRLGLTADFFVLGERIGKPDFLSAEQITEMYANGMRFGSHGMAHVSWKKMSLDKAEYEIKTGLKTLQSVIDVEVDSVACPFGTYDRNTLKFLKQSGVKRVYSSDGGYSDICDWLIARNSVHAGDNEKTLIDLMHYSSRPYRRFIINFKKLVKRLR